DHLEYHGVVDSEGEVPVIYRTAKYEPELFMAKSLVQKLWIVSPRVAGIMKELAPYIGISKIRTRIVTCFNYDSRAESMYSHIRPGFFRKQDIINERWDMSLTIPWLGVETLPGYREFLKNHPRMPYIIADHKLQLRLALERHSASDRQYYAITSMGSDLVLTKEAFDVLSPYLDPEHVTLNEFHMTLPDHTT